MCISSLYGYAETFQECQLTLLANNILNTIGQTLVVVVAKSRVFPVKLGKELIILDIILKDALVVTYHQVINSLFSITCGINSPKVSFKFKNKL